MNAVTVQPIPLNRPRERAFTWDDPLVVAERSRSLSGMELFKEMIAGRTPIPPIGVALDFRMTEAEKGRVVFEMEPQEFHYNPIGTMHGGVISTLLDSAMGCAVHSTLKAGVGYTSLEIKVNFVRPITVDTGRLICEGKTLTTGRTTALAEGRILDERGRLLAHGSTTCAIFRPTS